MKDSVIVSGHISNNLFSMLGPREICDIVEKGVGARSNGMVVQSK